MAVTLRGLLAFDVVMNVRFDVVVLLFQRYGFWYLVVVNSVTWGLVAVYFSDLRAVVGVLLWLSLLNSNFVDAKTMGQRKTVAENLVDGLVSTAMLVLIQWGVVPTVCHFTVFQYREHALCVENLIANRLAPFTISPDASGHSLHYMTKTYTLNKMIYVDSGAVYGASETVYPA